MFISTEEEIDIVELEQRLELQKDPLQRILLLDTLIGNYVYTNVDRASALLVEQKELLRQQNLPDFLLNYWLHLANIHNQRYAYDLAAEALESAMQLLEERGALKQQAEAYIDYAGVLINLNRLEEAAGWLEKAERVLKNFPDQRLLARCQGRRGYLQLHIANYAKAIELLLSAERALNNIGIPLSLKDQYFLTLVLSGMGRVYEQNDELEKSVQAYRKVVQMSERLGLSGRLAWHYLNTGNAYLALDDYENAERYFRKTIDASDEGSLPTRAAANANLGYCYYVNERYEEALKLYDRAETLYRELSQDDYANFSNIAHWRGRLLFELDRDDDALRQLTCAYDYAQRADDTRRLASISKDIGALHADQGDYQRAYAYQLEHDRLTEQYVEKVDKRQQMELAVKYEAAKKQQEAELLKLQATRLQLKALRAQMNPHFLFNALNSIQSYISSNDTSSATRFLAKFAKLMRQSLDYSEMEIISLEKELEFLEDFLYINEKLRFENKLSYRIIVDDEIEEDILGVPTMIVQPYVENAIEHGLRTREQGLIEIRFAPIDDDTILCTVEDNGIGRVKAAQLRLADPRTKNHHSRGTSITEKRLELLHRSRNDQAVFVQTIDLYQDDGTPIGTRVEVKIPIVDIQVK